MSKVREELPRLIMKKNFFVKVPSFSEEEEEKEGLVDIRDDKQSIIEVVAVSPDCTVKVGDEVIMGPMTNPGLVIEVKGEQYAMFRELDVEAIW